MVNQARSLIHPTSIVKAAATTVTERRFEQLSFTVRRLQMARVSVSMMNQLNELSKDDKAGGRQLDTIRAPFTAI